MVRRISMLAFWRSRAMASSACRRAFSAAWDRNCRSSSAALSWGGAVIDNPAKRRDVRGTKPDYHISCGRSQRRAPALVQTAQVPGRDTSVSLLVMNSSSTGTPSFVFWMPRLIAGMMSSGLVTRSPWPPKARAIAA